MKWKHYRMILLHWSSTFNKIKFAAHNIIFFWIRFQSIRFAGMIVYDAVKIYICIVYAFVDSVEFLVFMLLYVHFFSRFFFWFLYLLLRILFSYFCLRFNQIVWMCVYEYILVEHSCKETHYKGICLCVLRTQFHV